MRQEHSFRTYGKSTVGCCTTEAAIVAQNARLERERARRYIDQANTALRLAKEALQRARSIEERG